MYKLADPSTTNPMKQKQLQTENMAIDQDVAMEFIASPLGTSDESCWSGSTSPTTPASSPFLGPSKGEDLMLSHSLNSPGLSDSALCDMPCSLQSFPPWSPVRNICVVGAGYVGRLVCPVSNMREEEK